MPEQTPRVVFDCNVMTTSTDVARQFRARYHFLRIMRAADFVTEMESLKIGKLKRGRSFFLTYWFSLPP